MSHTYAPAPAAAQAPTPAPATAQATTNASTPTIAQALTETHGTTPEPPANRQCHLTLGPHILWLCLHVSHPFTRGIVWRASPVSPRKCQYVRCGYETLIKNQVLFLSSKFV
ncbi:hypothetical protein O181_039866 [Austropuccinia psidii MF-1]|uniref:Uncharacterized protein n=1 Tax=Austropuccinia psidii MF-1 TaxID=1389203 RepID=A0A9Q3DGQ2_9BASI|nr:hypothetical protein [Austropuccinia psidii MF-1]